jgi:putative addiction module CopG family antidote
MRAILNISLPSDLSQIVNGMVKRGRYASTSEFVRDLIRERIEETNLLSKLEKSRTEIKSGRGRLLKSLKDLR